MKRIFFLLSFIIMIPITVMPVTAASLYDQVRPPMTFTAEEQELFTTGRIEKPTIPFFALKTGSIDFATQHGNQADISAEVGWLHAAKWKDYSLAPGFLASVKHDNTYSWKAGGFLKVEAPMILWDRLNPYAKISATYQLSNGNNPDAVVGGLSAGINFLIQKVENVKSSIGLELAYQKATKDIFFDYNDKVDNDLVLKMVLTAYY